MRRPVLVLGLAAAAHLADTPVARACGCLSPPAVTEGDYAVNQTGEQLIFEVEPGWVTAHVLIRYAGDPSQFAWIVPVPEVPELSVSPTSVFGLLDRGTAPNVQVTLDNLCPTTQWACHYEHDTSFGGGCGGESKNTPGGFGGALSDAGLSDAAGTGSPVTVLGEQTVGNYQTVTFQASQASAAVQWLQDNGFVVNNSTSIYMESYIQQNMVFVAAKLVPGAPATAITPLRMRYRAAYPSVPLILTAVAAQPHLTVTAFLFGANFFRPQGHPVVTVPADRLAVDPSGRFNYPMLLARTIDEHGGDAFTIEYSGSSSVSSFGTSSCCTSGFDQCHIANDGQCQCPGSDIDSADCASLGDLNDGITLLNQLSATYPYLTRITNRISPEDMTFDPTYEPDFTQMYGLGAIQVYGTQPTLSSCQSSVVDQNALARVQTLAGCDAMYCGKNALCVTTASGAACECANDQVAQRFIDLDGKPSVTCVPLVAPVDLRAGGAQLPDACAGVDCGQGHCLDRNGIAVCACNAGAAASLNQTTAPVCDTIVEETKSPGAESFDSGLRDLDVCAPPPPSCGDAKYDRITVTHPGVDCGNATPPVALQTSSGTGCCQQTPQTPPFVFMGGALLVLGTILRRRRCAA
jgi:hypothetical protein